MGSGPKELSYFFKSSNLVGSSICIQIPVSRVWRLLLIHLCNKFKSQRSYGDLIPGTRPRRENHEAADSRQLTLVDTNAPLCNLVAGQENQ